MSLAVACFAMGSIVEAFAPGPLKMFGQQGGARQLSAVCRQAKMQAAGGGHTGAGANGASSRVRRELLQVDTERNLSVQRQGLRGRAWGLGGLGARGHCRIFVGQHTLARAGGLCEMRILLCVSVQTAIAAPLVLGSAARGEAAAGKQELVLVVGATGGIGQYAIFDLLNRGYKVRGITRRAQKVMEQVKGTDLEQVEWVSGDLNDKTIFAPAMQGVNKVTHTHTHTHTHT